jgi:hypothetical protein
MRGLVLQSLYEIRHERGRLRVPDELAIPGMDMDNPNNLKMLGNIANQLAEKGLIEFRPVIGPYNTGSAWITASGVDVVEGSSRSPIAVVIDQSINIHGSSHVQVGQGHTQNTARREDNS